MAAVTVLVDRVLAEVPFDDAVPLEVTFVVVMVAGAVVLSIDFVVEAVVVCVSVVVVSLVTTIPTVVVALVFVTVAFAKSLARCDINVSVLC